MAVIPEQERFVDPYADIFSLSVNHRLMSIYPTGRGIIKGLELVDNGSLLVVQTGIVIKDFVTLNISETSIDVSTLSDGTYYVVLNYTYEVVYPPNQATIDLVPEYEGDGVILGRVTVESGTVTNIDYTERTRNALVEHLEILLSLGQLQSDIDMNGHKIVNLGSNDPNTFTDDLDAVNKAYVDYMLAYNTEDVFVKVDSDDSESGYLNDKIIAGENISKEIRNHDLSSPTPGAKHVLLISGRDDKIAVVTGDSTSSVLDDKIDTYNPLYKYIVDGGSGKVLQLKVHYDGEAESGSPDHGGQKTILTDNFTIDGESVLALYVADIFVHKAGSINETITGNKVFQDNVDIVGDLIVGGTINNFHISDVPSPDTIPVAEERHLLGEWATFIYQPIITNPPNGSTVNSQPTIEASPYTTTTTYYGSHEASDWEIATDEEFSNIVYSSYDDTVHKTSIKVNLDEGTYFARVRYKSDFHVSLWSEPVQFTVGQYVEAPVITCSTGDSLYPVFHLTPFTTHGLPDEWQSTDWEIATDPDFTNVIRAYTETDPEYQSVWSITDDLLDVNSTYYVRARYNGTLGHSSDWSDTYVLNTGLYVIEYTIPDQANEQEEIQIHVTHDSGREFDTSQYTLNGSVTLGTLTISGMDATWTLPEVEENTTASITLWVTRNSDSVDVTEHLTKSLTILNVGFVSDDAIIITDFSNSSYNNLWEIQT